MEKGKIVDYFLEYSGLKPQIIPRELEVPMNSGFIVSIIGPRRSGKTYYLFQLSKELGDHVYLNFEDSRLRGLSYREIRGS
jgi:predicted AAA+ superfamily ATPase